jgi:ribosomal protein L11 methyltransferase
MDYIQLTCTITSNDIELVSELLMQELADKGFESFEENAEGFLAYIPSKDFTSLVEESLPANVLGMGPIGYSTTVIKGQNWNEEWERNFQPVVIAEKCYIRAPFHEKKPEVPYEIVIEPKMAFGTGHHETTSLMIEQMFSIDLANKQVLDMGCGTGVLAIMASMLKAKHILAIDIDEWAYQNTMDNCSVNNINNVTIFQGDIDLISGKRFDVILANINRNILLHQIPSYSQALSEGGILLMSGIYKTDFEVILKATQLHSLEHISLIEKNNWIAVKFVKK